MNNVQINLMKKFPNLYRKQIKQAYQAGNLDELIIKIYYPNLIKILENEKIYIKINEKNYINYWNILYNQEFVDYILKHHIENINFINDEMIKDEHIKLYANYLKVHQFDFSNFLTFKNQNVLLNDEIIHILITKINSAKDLANFFAYINDENYLLEAIDFVKEKEWFNNLTDIYLSPKILNNHSIFKKMLNIFGNKFLEIKFYNIDLQEFMWEIIEALTNGDLIIDSCINPSIKKILEEPQIIKAILNSPNLMSMKNIFKNLNFDVNILTDDELNNLVKILYQSLKQDKTLLFKTSFENYLSNPLILKKVIELDYYPLQKSFTKEAYTLEVIKFFADNLKNKDIINIGRIIKRINYDDDIKQYYSHPYVINALVDILIQNLSEDNIMQKLLTPILKFYMELVVQNEDFEHLKLGIYFIKKYDSPSLIFFSEISQSPFLLKSLIILNEIDYMGLMKKEAFSKENINLLYQKIPFNEFITLNNIYNNFVNVFEQVDINSKEDYLKIFNNMATVDDIDDLKMFIIKKYDKSNLDDVEINNMRDYTLLKITNKLKQKYNDDNLVNTFIEKILNDERNLDNLKYIDSYKNLYVATYINDITSYDEQENIDCIPLTVLEKSNKKHIREIISLLNNLETIDKSQFSLNSLAYNIYLSIGYERAKDLLNPNPNKNYGTIKSLPLGQLFCNIDITNVAFKKVGNGYMPVLNEEWIKLIFGENYKIKNTPIRNHLNDFQDKRKEINELLKKVDNDLTLTADEKAFKKSEINNQFDNYQKEIFNFFNLCSTAFNEWDIITEEFIKNANKTKLKTKLNIAKVNEILKLIKDKRKLPELGVEDDLLIQSDVFNYVGYDNQFTMNHEKAPARAINISRKMNNYQKKFPNITINENNLTLYVYNPQDRRILSAGYRSNCCFRANGNADNYGGNNSLLYYCATNEYGGGLEIKDLNNNTIMFSPILRNGNVLMIHSIETNGLGYYNDSVHELLIEYGNKVIEESEKNDDNIEFVAITNLHNLNTSYTMGTIPIDKKFDIYDPEHEFDGIYHNLNCEQFLLAKKENKFINDIKYNEEGKSYNYPKNEVYLSISITKEELDIINKIKKLHENIISLSNTRYNALKNNNEALAYELLDKINDEKSQYLKEYQEILKRRKGRDLYQEYNKALNTIKRINEELNINIGDNILDINMGTDWYIAFDETKVIYAHALKTGENKLKEELKKYQKIRDDLTINNEDIMKL